MNDASCFNCPNVIAPGESAAYYGQHVPVFSCKARGIVIATAEMDHQDQEDAAADRANGCPSYGKRPQKPQENIALRIGLFAPEAPKQGGAPVNTCRACYFYVPAAKMAEEVSIPVGACSRFGRLIPDLRAADIAKNCSVSTRANTPDPEAHYRKILDTFAMDPVLKRWLQPDKMAAGELRDSVDTSIDPSQYPTDRPVTAQQDAAGIRAWRRLTMNGNEVFLPIFKREIFSEAEQAKIPTTGDDEHPETYVDHMQMTFTVAALWFHLDETPALHGKAGTGKTEFFRYMAWLMQLPFERISITRDSEIDDLAGKMHLRSKVIEGAGEESIQSWTEFVPGRIPKAWVKPCVIVLDEPNTGPPEVWQYIRPLTDNSKQLVNDKNEGEVIKRHPFAFLGMAMNPAWDARNVGAEMIGDADGSRLMHIFVDMPPAAVEREIIRERCKLDGYDIEDDKLNQIMKIAERLREMSDNGELPVTWGVRNQIKVARATRWFGMSKSYNLGVLDYLEPDTKEMVANVVTSVVNDRSQRTNYSKGGLIK